MRIRIQPILFICSFIFCWIWILDPQHCIKGFKKILWNGPFSPIISIESIYSRGGGTSSIEASSTVLRCRGGRSYLESILACVWPPFCSIPLSDAGVCVPAWRGFCGGLLWGHALRTSDPSRQRGKLSWLTHSIKVLDLSRVLLTPSADRLLSHTNY